MGNCVARDLGFQTESLEKNKILMNKLQEVANIIFLVLKLKTMCFLEN